MEKLKNAAKGPSQVFRFLPPVPGGRAAMAFMDEDQGPFLSPDGIR
jgi:hypothetical protein